MDLKGLKLRWVSYCLKRHLNYRIKIIAQLLETEILDERKNYPEGQRE